MPTNSTTIYEGYPGDNVRLRIGQGSHEESHSFNAYGMRWNDLFTDPDSRIVNQQIVKPRADLIPFLTRH